jgi:hypothetical protein
MVVVLVGVSGCMFRVNPNYQADGGAGSPRSWDAGADAHGRMDGAVAADLASGPHLAGMVAASPASTDLSAEGRSDWAHFGWFSFLTGDDVDRKATGGGQISSYQLIDALLTGSGDSSVAFTWSDGTPHQATETGGTSKNVYVSGMGKGFSITAPADETERTLKVYVGGAASSGTFSAQLDDASAPAFADQSQSSMREYHAVYTLRYRAAHPNAKLIVKWAESQDFGLGSVLLEAATLF